MESIKKKGNTLKKMAALVWFVFCALSFLFLINSKSYAEKIQYTYTFDLGSGSTIPDSHGNSSAIDDIKLVLTVEEDTSKPITDNTRYNIIDRKIDGYRDFTVTYNTEKNVDHTLTTVSTHYGFDLNSTPQQTIYNFLCYGSLATTSEKSRKVMKDFLFGIVEDGHTIYAKENGDRIYLKKDKNYVDTDDDDVTRDNTYTDYLWLYDHEWIDVDFKGYFDQRSTEGYTPFNPEYAKEDMNILLAEGAGGNLYSFLNNDINMLTIINANIEKGTPMGNDFKAMKKEYKHEEDPEQAPTATGEYPAYCWWYQEGSYDKDAHSVIIECGPKKGDKKFAFKYVRDGSEIRAIDTGALQKTSIYGFNYLIDSYSKAENNYSVHPDVTDGSVKKVSNYIYYDSGYIYNVDYFHVAIDSMSTEGKTDGYIRVVRFNKNEEKQTLVFGKVVCSIAKKDIEKIMDNEGDDFDETGLLLKYDRGYTFAYDPNKKTVAFYKTDDETYTGMNMKFSDFYSVYFDNKGNQYGLSPKADQTGRTKTSFKKANEAVNGNPQYRFPTLRSNKQVVNSKGEKYSDTWSASEKYNAMMYCLVNDPDFDVFLSVYDLTGIDVSYRGQTKAQTVARDNVTLIAEVSVREWLFKEDPKTVKKMEEIIEAQKTPGIKGAVRHNENVRKDLKDFLKTVGKYIKPIFMFLVFISVVLAAIFAMLDNQDAEKRVLLKIRLRNILIGIIFFLMAIAVIQLAAYYFDEAAKELNNTETAISYNVDGAYEEDTSWFIWLIKKFMNAISSAVKWFVDFVGSRLLMLSDTKLNIADAIFNVDQGGGLSLYPFSDVEWVIFMYGYAFLSTIFICLIGLALVKNTAMIIINAGNSEREAEVKQDYLRAVVAIICVILVPYAFRLLLLLVNGLVKLVPVSETKFDILETEFDKYGLLGCIAKMYYAFLELKVYAVFAVRKLMLTFMLISTPVVFGIWAYSSKFKSFSYWIGEIVTNAFMQVSYAFTFFFLVVILSTENNPIAVLLLLTMILKLSDFIKDSLQGLFNAWGGVDETKTAISGLNEAKSIGKTAINYADRAKRNTGHFLQNLSKFKDPKGVTNSGYALYTAGGIISGDYRRALMRGNLGRIRTKKDLANARRNLLASEAGDVQTKANRLRRDLNLDNKDVDELYKKYELGTLTREDIEKLTHSKDKDVEDLRTFIETNDEAGRLKQTYYDLEKTVNETSGILSSMQDSQTGKIVDEYVSKFGSSPVSTIYQDMKRDFNNNVKDMENSFKEFSEGNLPDDLKEEKQKHIEEVINNIVSGGMALSQIAVDIDLDLSDIDIASGQKEAMRIRTQGLNNYNFNDADKIDKTNENIKKFNEKHSK